MPVDSQRNMMNASSNYRIIDAIIFAVRTREKQKLFIPGAFGEIGGYPVWVGYKDEKLDVWIDETEYSFEDMNRVNCISMALDGIERIEEGKLVYTDSLIKKVKDSFGVDLQKQVSFEEIDSIAEYIINRIINPELQKVKK